MTSDGKWSIDIRCDLQLLVSLVITTCEMSLLVPNFLICLSLTVQPSSAKVTTFKLVSCSDLAADSYSCLGTWEYQNKTRSGSHCQFSLAYELGYTLFTAVTFYSVALR